MSELQNPRVPGLGLAPARAAQDLNPRQQDALVRDAFAVGSVVRADEARAANLFDVLRRRVRGTGVRMAATEAPAVCHPSRPIARA